MKKQICLLLLILGFSNRLFCQDTEFIWRLNSSLGGYAYSVKIEKTNSNCSIKFCNENPKDSAFASLDDSDCDSLFNFLSKYTFKTKGSSKILEIVKDYQEIKLLNDSNWILLKGDSIRLETAILNGLIYDKIAKKYYYENYKVIAWTDGITFSGKLKLNNMTNIFNIYSGRISEEDYTLNKIIVSLVKKYFSNQYISKLIELSEGAKPVKKEYQ